MNKNEMETNISRPPEWFNCECPICGKKFHLKPSQKAKGHTHYCSRECHRKAKTIYMRGEGNHQYGLKGSKNATWKSDKMKSGYGYIMIRVLDHPFREKGDFVFEHRLVAEKYLLTPENSIEIDGKLYLRPEYEVHHKNFDRTDNRPENLEVLTRKQHKQIHNRLNPNARNEKGQFVKSPVQKIKVKRVTETAIVPERLSIGAAGFDMYVDSENPIIIKPRETIVLHSGIAFEIPRNYYGAIYARSGLATKLGLRPATCVSIIDSDYRGEVRLPIYNDSDEARTISPHERVAQIIFQEAVFVDIEIVDHLEDTERGTGGFGSTGKF